MAAEYQHLRDAMDPTQISDNVLRYADSATIPPDPGNRDRQIYNEYTAAGGVTDPPDPLPEPPPPEPDANVRLDTGAQAAKTAWDANTPAAADRAGAEGGMSTEERLVRLEASLTALVDGHMTQPA